MPSSLRELLTEDVIRIKIDAADWEDAIRKGAQLLIDSGGAEQRYADEIIKMIHQLGPYVVLAPGLALGHAGPDAGVIHTCFSLMTLSTPVEFGAPDNDPVDIVFSFAAPNKQEHMQALRDMAMFCSENKNLEFLRKATKATEVTEYLKKYFEK